MKNGANVTIANNKGKTPLYRAIVNGKYSFTRWTDRNASIYWTIAWRRMDLMEYFFPIGLDKIVELLIENGADINAKDEDGDSMLSVAAAAGKWLSFHSWIFKSYVIDWFI